MDASVTITISDRWIARVAESYPRLASALLTKEPDPFRNPVGDAMRRGLSCLLGELFGAMDAAAIDSALDPIVRLQVVQGIASGDAARFVSLLKPILQELVPKENLAVLDGRVDRLAVLTEDKYTECREQLARIRANEMQRASYVQQRIRARGPA